MKLGMIRIGGGRTQAVRVDGDVYIELDGYSDLSAVMAAEDWMDMAGNAQGRRIHADASELVAPVGPAGKTICVGANYRRHIQEMGSDVPEYPTLFAKYPEALIGPAEEIALPAEDASVDWEGELALVIGRRARRVSEEEAEACIAGYTVMNDVSMRGYQFRTEQWLQGKTWEDSTPVGPLVVTPDEFDWRAARIVTELNGEVMQDSTMGDLVFAPAALVAYISRILTLNPGDIIATGTPSGVGVAKTPQRFLRHGDELITRIDGIGALRNRVTAHASALV